MRGSISSALFAFLCSGFTISYGQILSLHGQASGWLTSNPEQSLVSQIGLRYLPEFTFEQKIDSALAADMDLSLNSYTEARLANGQRTEYEGKVKLYRAWLRLLSDRFEIRGGLQKMNFGSATLFRPLRWFDRVDPRDPLQLTDGVYGLLARYYFPDNANIWLWGLYGNDETKGWEVVPTSRKSVEYGGRVQIPMWTGEFGATYHHREADNSILPGIPDASGKTRIPENRFALDGKWDIGIGAWFEAALINEDTDLPGLKYQRQWTLGADYTFSIGNGLTALTEYFRSDNPDMPLASASGLGFSALSLNYPLGLVDRISGILYRDWSNQQWYRLITWQRTYDNWLVYLIGFWNPKDIQLRQSQTPTTLGQTVSNPFAGTGIQLMIVFNH